MLQRGVKKFFHSAEIHYLVKFRSDFLSPHTKNRAVKKNVFSSRQFRMKSRAHFQQATDAAIDIGVSLARLGDARENFQQRALAGAVAPDDPDDLARRDLEADVAERPEIGELPRGRPLQPPDRGLRHPDEVVP